MTVEKRYQVFVSSTYEDLHEERQEIIQALLELDCIPAGMELFPAANEDQWTLIKKVIDDCDYYLVVVGGRYGSIGPSGISYTHMEYEYAVTQGKPVIGFLHKDPGTLSAKHTEKTDVGKEKLEAFRTVVQKKMCKFWTTPADLGSAVSRSLVKLIKTNPAVGWVKADLLPEKSSTEEILRLRQQIEDLQNQLKESQQTAAVGTEDLAQGDDQITLHYKFGSYRTKDWTPDDVFKASFEVTWNQIFSAVSPLLIDEASDVVLRKALNDFIQNNERPRLASIEKLKGAVLKNFVLADEDYNTIKIQLLALNLIAKSNKKKNRSVSDKAAYWMLTSKGETAMMTLRAIRKLSFIQDVEAGTSSPPKLTAAKENE